MLVIETTHTGVAKARAGRVRNEEQIPAIVQQLARVAANMAIATVLGGQEIA